MPAPRNLALSALALIASLAVTEWSFAASFTYMALNTDGANPAYPAAANSHDQVVGVLRKGGAFVWASGNLTAVKGTRALYAINDSGVALGYAAKRRAFASYDTKTGTLTYVPISFCHARAGDSCVANGINSAGEVVGSELVGGGSVSALGFFWSDGAAQKILPPHEKQSDAVAINKAGDILIANPTPYVYHNVKFTEIYVPVSS